MAAEDWLKGIVRICDRAGQTVGTGFLVAPDWVVTCAHVVDLVDDGPVERVPLVLLGNGQPLTARVVPEYWQEPGQEDVAVLRLGDRLPWEAQPLFLGTSSRLKGQRVSTHGFIPAKARNGLRGTGVVVDEIKHENGTALLQVSSAQMTVGFSGAPLVHEKTGRVVGMVSEILAPDRYDRGGETVFAIPSRVLWKICPALAPRDVCPYVGLAAFTEQEAEFFFGRETLVQELVAHLRLHPQFLAVVGASGSGKSSVVQAGLWPRLREKPPNGFSKNMPIFQLRPSQGVTPEAALWAALPIAVSESEGAGWSQVRSFLQGQRERVILFIDQFEELFALFPDQQAAFMAGLDDLLRWLSWS